MADAYLLEKLDLTRLRQRTVSLPCGGACYRLGDGWVRIDRADFERLSDGFAAAVAPSARLLRWSVRLTIPFAILVLAILSNVPGLMAAAESFDRAVPFVLPLLVMVGLPLAAMALHARRTTRAIGRIEECLAPLPRCPAPDKPHDRRLDSLELIGLFVVGPYLLVQIVGTLWPDAFRNTPWTGSHLDLKGMIGIAVLAAIVVLRRRARRRSSARPGSEGAIKAGREVDALARARRA